MNADVEKLVTLQALDLELKHLRAELAELPRRVARAETERDEAERALEAARKSLRDEEALRRRQELDIAERGAKRARLRQQLDAATSGAQITALEHEIQFAEAAIAKLEDEEFASMERTEASEKAEQQAAALLARRTSGLETERARAADAEAAARKGIAERETERTALRATVEERALMIYDRVSKTRGTGLSEALDHKCSACQMMVRPQRWNDLTGRDHDHELFPCETCGRLLFWDPRRDAPGAWAPGERLSAAMAGEARR